ncbi:MAG: hypothetical protein AYK23_04865 [Candidatus Proteinoplasmatales archaeon SG8-5]|nr:MAG: hypothetical protein AYK23_04865 [Candidatus Proteinoplasmatales archaeon SG8-5]
MINIDELIEKAEANDSDEFIISVERNDNHNIAVGVRTRKGKTDKFQIFTAISIKLGIRENCSVDLDQLIKATGELYAFKQDGYCLCYGGDGIVYAEKETSRKDVEKQLDRMKTMMANSH